MSHATAHVLGQDRAKTFSTEKLGFEVRSDTAEQLRSLVAKGAFGVGVLETDDCVATHAQLAGRGVVFMQEPVERPYGIEATFRDDSGNWYSLTQQTR